MMESKWKRLREDLFVSCEEVTPQRKNAAFALIAYITCSMGPAFQFDTRKRFREYLPALLTAAVTYSGIYMDCFVECGRIL